MKVQAAKRYRLLARHTRWVAGATISEFANDENSRRFTATIRGWQKWLIWEGSEVPVPVEAIRAKVREIMSRIDAGDESVFELPQGVSLASIQ
jgi:hypothetical protein